MRRSYLALVSAQLGTSNTDVISEVPITNEYLDLILEHDVLLCGVIDILVIPEVLVLISFGVVSSQWIRSLVDACPLGA